MAPCGHPSRRRRTHRGSPSCTLGTMPTARDLAARGLMRARRMIRAPRTVDPFSTAEPLSRLFGLDRGQPIDRFYIERFLQAKSDLIRGHVLEVGGRDYTER